MSERLCTVKQLLLVFVVPATLVLQRIFDLLG